MESYMQITDYLNESKLPESHGQFIDDFAISEKDEEMIDLQKALYQLGLM